MTTETRGDLTVVTLSGELDIYTVGRFREDVQDLEPASTRIIIDLSDVTLVDSSGLGALVSLLNRSREGDGQLGLVCPQRRLRRVFEIAGLRRAFTFGDDYEAVVGALEDALRQ
jgi:anti-sigma B factor antagonist